MVRQPGCGYWRKSICRDIGEEKCLSHLLNSPGNFTASKLRWVYENEPALYEKIYKIMLPGDYIAMKLTGDVSINRFRIIGRNVLGFSAIISRRQI